MKHILIIAILTVSCFAAEGNDPQDLLDEKEVINAPKIVKGIITREVAKEIAVNVMVTKADQIERGQKYWDALDCKVVVTVKGGMGTGYDSAFVTNIKIAKDDKYSFFPAPSDTIIRVTERNAEEIRGVTNWRGTHDNQFATCGFAVGVVNDGKRIPNMFSSVSEYDYISKVPETGLLIFHNTYSLKPRKNEGVKDQIRFKIFQVVDKP